MPNVHIVSFLPATPVQKLLAEVSPLREQDDANLITVYNSEEEVDTGKTTAQKVSDHFARVSSENVGPILLPGDFMSIRGVHMKMSQDWNSLNTK